MTRFDYNLDGAALSRPSRHFFSVSEANRSLVLIRRIVEDIIEEYRLLTDLHETVEAAQRTGRYDQGEAARDRLVRSVERIQDYVSELDAIGVDLKDWTLGVVHFPSIATGREVVLCWEAGEAEVGHWHEIDSELADRKSIETLPADTPAAARV